MSAAVKQSTATPPNDWQIKKMLEIAMQHLALIDQQTDPAAEFLETDAAEMMAILKGKGANIAGFMQALLLAGDEAKAEAAMLAEREKQMAERRRRRLRKQDALRNAALNIMLTLPELFPGGKFRSPLVDARAQNGRLTAMLVDETKIPDRFFVTTRTLDKNALNEAVVNDGEVVPGAEQRNGAPFLVVKVA
jgi:hypothetical protein